MKYSAVHRIIWILAQETCEHAHPATRLAALQEGDRHGGGEEVPRVG